MLFLRFCILGRVLLDVPLNLVHFSKLESCVCILLGDLFLLLVLLVVLEWVNHVPEINLIVSVYFVRAFWLDLLIVLLHCQSQLLCVVITRGLAHLLVVFHLGACEGSLFGLSDALVITFILSCLSLTDWVFIHGEVLHSLLCRLIFLLLDEIVLHLLEYFRLELRQNLVILFLVWVRHCSALRPHNLWLSIIRRRC